MPADLQSAPVGRFGTSPSNQSLHRRRLGIADGGASSMSVSPLSAVTSIRLGYPAGFSSAQIGEEHSSPSARDPPGNRIHSRLGSWTAMFPVPVPDSFLGLSIAPIPPHDPREAIQVCALRIHMPERVKKFKMSSTRFAFCFDILSNRRRPPEQKGRFPLACPAASPENVLICPLSALATFVVYFTDHPCDANRTVHWLKRSLPAAFRVMN